jgi:hypothetical protein
MTYILLNRNYIDLWLNTQLGHDLYLKSMEGRFPMIDCGKLFCKIFFFCIKILPQVASWLGSCTVSLLEHFNHIKKIGAMIFDLLV